MESWKNNRRAFWALALPGGFWLAVFFVIPLGLMWFMSFGEKAVIDGEVSITEIDITGTLANYMRSFDPLYLTIIWKSIWISALATALCLVDRLSDRLRHLLRAGQVEAAICCCSSSCRSGSIS